MITIPFYIEKGKIITNQYTICTPSPYEFVPIHDLYKLEYKKLQYNEIVSCGCGCCTFNKYYDNDIKVLYELGLNITGDKCLKVISVDYMSIIPIPELKLSTLEYNSKDYLDSSKYRVIYVGDTIQDDPKNKKPINNDGEKISNSLSCLPINYTFKGKIVEFTYFELESDVKTDHEFIISKTEYGVGFYPNVYTNYCKMQFKYKEFVKVNWYKYFEKFINIIKQYTEYLNISQDFDDIVTIEVKNPDKYILFFTMYPHNFGPSIKIMTISNNNNNNTS